MSSQFSEKQLGYLQGIEYAKGWMRDLIEKNKRHDTNGQYVIGVGKLLQELNE